MQTAGCLWGRGGVHPHPNLPPSRGEEREGEGRGKMGPRLREDTGGGYGKER